MPIKAWLAELSSVLFYPVTLLLLGVCVWITVSLGLFLRSWLVRAQGGRPARNRYIARLDAAAAEAGAGELDIALEEVVQRAEIEATRSLNAVRFAIRAGPSLGLMGTLIPMAAALNGLARGDLPSLADNMVVAFSATVVGIAVGLLAYVLSIVRESWARADLDAVRFHAERLLRRVEARA